MTQYKKAIERQGLVSLNIIRCILVGPPKVGKSCLKHLLVHNQPKEVTIGTPVLESPEVVTFNPEQPKTHQGSSSSAPGFPKVGTFIPELYVINQECPSLWRPVNTDDMGEIIKKWTMKEEYEAQETQLTTRLDQGEAGSTHTNAEIMGGIEERHQLQDSTTGEKQSGAGSELPPLGNLTQRSIMPDGIESKVQSNPPNLVSSHSLKPSAVQHTDLQECHVTLLHDLEKGNLAHVLDQRQLTLIHVLDSGGQPAFQDTLPLLIGTPCTYIAVYNASVDLDQPVDITHRAQDGSETKLGHQLSQWDMMLRTFSSVHTMEYKCHEGIRQILQDGSTPPQSRIAVVGTHKDKLETLPTQSREYLKKKRTTLLESHGHYLVNNLEGFDAENINCLRKHLSTDESALRLKFPLVWLIVELTTQRVDQKFIPYSELKHFCLHNRYISEDDADAQFQSFLAFLHNLGFYAFYDLEGISEADNWVCTDAATLYREVSKLLVVQYIECPKKKATQRLKSRGIIVVGQHSELFEEIEFPDTIDHRWFFAVLQKVGVAAECLHGQSSGSKGLFIPLALPFNRATPPKQTSVANLCFTLRFKEKAIAYSQFYDLLRGIFPRLAVYLADQKTKSAGWEIDPCQSDRTTIKYFHKKSCIYLMERPCHLEVAILLHTPFFCCLDKESRSDKLHSFCSSISDTIKAALEYTCREVFGDDFIKKVTIESGFPCFCLGRNPSHLVLVKKEDKPINASLCALKNRNYECLSLRQLIWFSSEHPEVREDGQCTSLQYCTTVEPLY